MLQAIAVFSRIVLGLLFVVTGVLKLPDIKGFYAVLLSYNMFPKWFARLGSYGLPFTELVVGAWLLAGYYAFYAASATLLLLFASNVVVLAALLKRKKIDNCGCYGIALKVPVTWKKFAENLVWMVLAAMIMYAG